MEPFVTMGLVLKETRYREADRILTILTPKLGVITAMAANSLRLKSKLFSACGLFCYSEFTLVPGRNMYTVREAEVQNIFHGVSSSIEGVSLAMYLTEMAAALSPTGEEAARDAFQPFLIDLVRICHYQTQPGGAVRGGNQIFPAANAFKNRSGAGGVIQCPHAFLLRCKSEPENTRKRFRLIAEYG